MDESCEWPLFVKIIYEVQCLTNHYVIITNHCNQFGNFIMKLIIKD